MRGLPQAPPRLGDANGTSTAGERAATPSGRCGVRFSVKLPPASPCGPAAMISCLTTTSTNTDNAALLLFGHALVAPVLLSGLSATDELLAAVTCRFALDIFTIVQQGHPVAVEEATPMDLELQDLG